MVNLQKQLICRAANAMAKAYFAENVFYRQDVGHYDEKANEEYVQDNQIVCEKVSTHNAYVYEAIVEAGLVTLQASRALRQINQLVRSYETTFGQTGKPSQHICLLGCILSSAGTGESKYVSLVQLRARVYHQTLPKNDGVRQAA